MNKAVPRFFVCLLFLFCLSTLTAKETILQDTFIETDGEGLTIDSLPSKAIVYIDGIRRGISPLSLPSLTPGKYQIDLVKEGYETRTVLVTLANGKHVDLTLVLAQAMGQLIINLERAPGAPGPEELTLHPEVYVDDVITDTTFLKLPVGLHYIRVEAFGWETYEKTLMVFQDLTQVLRVPLQAAQFRISNFRSERRRLNPHNPGLLGATGIAFSVSTLGTATISIYDANNNPVYEYRFPPFSERNQHCTWNGTDQAGHILRDGIYTIVLNATSIPYDTSEPIHINEQITITIDSSLLIRPWSIGSGGAGLLYLSIPETLAPRSFQVASRLAFGYPYGAGAPYISIPFSLGLRYAPADKWELALSGEFDASRDPRANQFSLGLRRTLLAPSPSLPLSLGADFSWTLAELSSQLDPSGISWSGSQGGPRLGLSFLVPLGTYFSIGVNPGILWPMDLYGSGASLIPDVELGAGVIGTGKTITGGLSGKLFWQNGEVGPIMGAAELHWFPKPSVFVFHLAGGLWQYQEKIGGFGSIGFGIIN